VNGQSCSQVRKLSEELGCLNLALDWVVLSRMEGLASTRFHNRDGATGKLTRFCSVSKEMSYIGIRFTEYIDVCYPQFVALSLRVHRGGPVATESSGRGSAKTVWWSTELAGNEASQPDAMG
jgi:hypothetical protein